MTIPDLSKMDFGDHTPTASTDSLKQLSDLVEQAMLAEADVDEALEDLANKQAKLKGLLEHDLPELMLELKQPVLHTPDGRKIEIKDVVRGTLPAPNRPKGYAWLMDNGHAGLIKRTVEIAFPAVEGDKAQALLASMETEYGPNARQVMQVAPATMTAFIKKQLKDEVDIPREIFNVAEFKHAFIAKKK